MSESVFPDHFPEGCPPATAEAASGTAYRCVKNEPATDKDFETYYELEKLPSAKPCERRAVSVFRTLQQAYHLSRIRREDVGDKVAEGTLATGKMHVNPKSGHINWWCPKDVDRKATFTKVTVTPPLVAHGNDDH